MGDNLVMDIKGTGCETVDWIQLVQNLDNRRAIVNTATNIWIP